MKMFLKGWSRPVSCLLGGAGFLVLAACTGSDTPESSVNADIAEPALAMVAGTAITESDIELLLERVGGDQALVYSAQLLADKANRVKLLESLINSRAMAKVAEQELSSDELQEIRHLVRFYEEELLVKRYLDRHAQVQPVSMQMVKDYYQEHQQEFEDEPQYRFEVLTSYGELSESQRQAVLKAFEQAQSAADWKQLEARLYKDNIPVRLQQVQARPSLLTGRLRNLVQNTEPGTVSPVLMEETVQIVRVLERIPGAVKPLAEVSSEIRKRLAPVMMKKAIAEAAQQARSQISVQYAVD